MPKNTNTLIEQKINLISHKSLLQPKIKTDNPITNIGQFYKERGFKIVDVTYS